MMKDYVSTGKNLALLTFHFQNVFLKTSQRCSTPPRLGRFVLFCFVLCCGFICLLFSRIRGIWLGKLDASETHFQANFPL